ncbi:hypothetical protein [Floridanema evergladense]|uniref:Uncharacterized protein n=1 Tax=Floridaenema evergladense BLCC-F167 TaxID=3153639 RepID=A0ABV4WDG8_9CYAN
MISRKRFTEEIEILCDWFGRKFEEKTLNRLYDRLNANGLTEEEFSKACLTLFDTSSHFPNPQAFVDAARGDREGIAAKEWELVVKAAASSSPEYFLKKVSDPGMAAIKEIGGLRKLGQMEQKELPFIRKEYIERWLKLDQNFKTEAIEITSYKQPGGNNGLSIN